MSQALKPEICVFKTNRPNLLPAEEPATEAGVFRWPVRQAQEFFSHL